MRTRFTFVVAAALAGMTAPSMAAEPAKAPAPQPSTPANRPAEVLLASSAIRGAPQQHDGQVSPPAKRPRAARVTSCRCGDQATPPQQP